MRILTLSLMLSTRMRHFDSYINNIYKNNILIVSLQHLRRNFDRLLTKVFYCVDVLDLVMSQDGHTETWPWTPWPLPKTYLNYYTSPLPFIFKTSFYFSLSYSLYAQGGYRYRQGIRICIWICQVGVRASNSNFESTTATATASQNLRIRKTNTFFSLSTPHNTKLTIKLTTIAKITIIQYPLFATQWHTGGHTVKLFINTVPNSF